MDNINIEDIYNQAGVKYYDNDVQVFIKKIIFEMYQSNWHLLKNIQIYHIDHAIAKFKEARETKEIYNTKNYFKACLKSAIEELDISVF
jgi:hypothetical protein